MNPRSTAFRQERQQLFSQGLRRCSGCLEILELEHFTTAVNGANGINGQCNPCRSSAHRDRYFGLYEGLRDGALRAREAGLPVDPITPKQLLESWESRGIDPWECVVTGEKLTQETRNIDHLHPLAWPDSPGHRVDNLVPVLAGFNRFKGRRHFVEAVADWWKQPGNTPKVAEGWTGLEGQDHRPRR